MAYEYVDYRLESRIAFITLNRPEKRNALNEDFVTELKAAFKAAKVDKDCRVVVLKANGKAFSAGADLAYLKQLQANTYEENLEDSRHLKELFQMIYSHPKPVIAQIEGHAIAGGCGLATVCDFSFSVPDALFGYTEVKIGFIPAIVMIFLLRKIGEGKAKELLLTGKLISAEAAKHFGLINGIYPPEEIAETVKQFAEELARTASGDSLALTKEMIAEVQHMPFKDGLDFAAAKNAEARATDDCKKGIQSFLDKNQIVW
jgi:methylglutaconyl-CoA hydratase